uniref:Glutaredoxin domain-containing protein n=1 Tax=Polytomella parva TaxID=51329 RepID=A0A7S0UUK5_9CHLO|nr:glutaredoxin, CPYc type (GRX) [Polytomella parva]|mmetsp:Transcript_22713/g.40215  ORF Transcript_22713/g.40215 Transcript_22713/m.40215 type:complete len:104 (+) Transcript_22713:51-362(+)|eukprot:CAMPEP_0175076538 /NCGR_PEP_ID=MMETSP0052_2-20121109/22793_1 /TAXON_ID=51329 ORGANISM="Polytomella parva, Strain SAG 63-3" /NCGR_SAMPLE_ID=MMETSP0052_2 /ASSEMBLY_ACC=CAM_ASM_000194 /LENGTH=103 /DNA_ID=CAMNT_0016345709 /DNA_START=22 /DNA_END=333 /DNA_ORIENTATION=+
MASSLVQNMIMENKVVVFSKSYCPYCVKAKKALQSVGLKEFHVMELESNPECDNIQDALAELTGARSVPRVFVNGKFIGGGDDTARLAADGSLVKMLKNVGVL